MDHPLALVVACATAIEEMLRLLSEGAQHPIFDFGLHINLDRLRHTL